ncbi:hypothetical protein ARC20_04990 [Stenotrophomonas panacihumi]|uniref:Uncharacterized protein n=1 Tax=Stenotrophomonas panacihumi TaxID=676599 RepID=A0A0R0AN78_9GAMM|nr:hypothetical protein [Stenotrophomonas panacihumi]KRG46671.1 hypothetical protein ARC20_04990 [Stenotrophomonas panacihumi]PTN53241.1 hypothetical protein C9J98_16685 [Stenotrophomonas panacihumi]
MSSTPRDNDTGHWVLITECDDAPVAFEVRYDAEPTPAQREDAQRRGQRWEYRPDATATPA